MDQLIDLILQSLLVLLVTVAECRYGNAGTIKPAARIVRIAPIGSTIPDNTPLIKARGLFSPSAHNGMDMIAPSGKFCIAIPKDSANAPIAVIVVFPDK